MVSVNEQIAFVDSFLHADASKVQKLTMSKRRKKWKNKRTKETEKIIEEEKEKERYITRNYKKLIKEFKRTP